MDRSQCLVASLLVPLGAAIVGEPALGQATAQASGIRSHRPASVQAEGSGGGRSLSVSVTRMDFGDLDVVDSLLSAAGVNPEVFDPWILVGVGVYGSPNGGATRIGGDLVFSFKRAISSGGVYGTTDGRTVSTTINRSYLGVSGRLMQKLAGPMFATGGVGALLQGRSRDANASDVSGRSFPDEEWAGRWFGGGGVRLGSSTVMAVEYGRSFLNDAIADFSTLSVLLALEF